VTVSGHPPVERRRRGRGRRLSSYRRAPRPPPDHGRAARVRRPVSLRCRAGAGGTRLVGSGLGGILLDGIGGILLDRLDDDLLNRLLNRLPDGFLDNLLDHLGGGILLGRVPGSRHGPMAVG
jgi:hypothetical protein